MAVAGFILGILGMALALFPVYLLVPFPLSLLFAAPAVLGMVFSGAGLSAARTTGRGKWVAVPGLALSGCAGAWIVLVLVVGSGLQGGAAADRLRASAQSVLGPKPADPGAAVPVRLPDVPSATEDATPAETTPPVPPVPPPPSPEVTELMTRVESLKNSAAHLGAEETWRRVVGLRERADALSADSDVGAIPEELDGLVVRALELEVARLTEEARAALKREAFDAAQEDCQRAMALHTSDAVPALSSGAALEPPDLAGVKDILERSTMYRDPGNRFRVTRFLKGPKGAVVSIDDHLTDASYDVEEGRRFGAFKLVRVNAADGSATIERGDKVFTIYQ
jgi:hypothetical protein